MGYKKERFESAIARLLAQEIGKAVEIEGVIVTILDVVIGDDRREAAVRVGVFPDVQKSAVLKILRKRAPHFAYALLKKLNVKRIPILVFE